MSELVLEFLNVSKSFREKGKQELHILRNACVQILKGEIVALVGASGIGKTTTLQIAGLLDTADFGQVKICGEEAGYSNAYLRREKIGFIYQFHHLLEEFNVLKNVMLPLLIAGFRKNTAIQEATKLLELLELKELANRSVSELSGGQRQRIAVARAMVKKPVLIIADEPTGNLDPKNAERVFELILRCAKENGSAVFLATHNLSFLKSTDRVLKISDYSFISAL